MGILKRVAHTINTYGNTPINDSNVTPAQIASGVATAGNIVSQVPTFYTKTAGTVLSVPDQIFDVAALIDEPKNSNAGHVILNYAPQLAEILTPNMKYDDYLWTAVTGAANAAGAADDAVSIGGNDTLSFLNNRKLSPIINNPSLAIPTQAVGKAINKIVSLKRIK